MKCENHPSVNAIALCENCSIPLCGFCSNYVGQDVYCEKCEQIAALSEMVEKKSAEHDPGGMGALLEEGEHQARQAPRIEQPKASGHNDRSEKIQMAIVIICCIFIVVQITRSLGSGAMLNQQEIAVQEQIRNNIEACMLVFWEIAMRFSNDQPLDTGYRCPGSTQALTVTRNGAEVTVRHPQPETLGVTDIYVSKSEPTPILIE